MRRFSAPRRATHIPRLTYDGFFTVGRLEACWASEPSRISYAAQPCLHCIASPRHRRRQAWPGQDGAERAGCPFNSSEQQFSGCLMHSRSESGRDEKAGSGVGLGPSFC